MFIHALFYVYMHCQVSAGEEPLISFEDSDPSKLNAVLLFALFSSA